MSLYLRSGARAAVSPWEPQGIGRRWGEQDVGLGSFRRSGMRRAAALPVRPTERIEGAWCRRGTKTACRRGFAETCRPFKARLPCSKACPRVPSFVPLWDASPADRASNGFADGGGNLTTGLRAAPSYVPLRDASRVDRPSNGLADGGGNLTTGLRVAPRFVGYAESIVGLLG